MPEHDRPAAVSRVGDVRDRREGKSCRTMRTAPSRAAQTETGSGVDLTLGMNGVPDIGNKRPDVARLPADDRPMGFPREVSVR